MLCLNETKIDPGKINSQGVWKEIPEGYEQHYNCCKIKNGYSGVAIFTKVKPVSVRHDIGVAKHDGEGRVLTIEFKSVILVAVYTPNAGEGLKRLKYRTEEWDEDFFKYIKSLESEFPGKAIIFTGDLNVAHKEIDIYDTKGKEKVAGFTP